MEISDVNSILMEDAPAAWKIISDFLLNIYREPKKTSFAEVQRREQVVSQFDNLLATASWDLWNDLHSTLPRSSKRLGEWWNENSLGKAVLVLDGLSLRELGTLTFGASQNGFEVIAQEISISEIPGDTTPFANALGVAQRSSFDNNKASSGFTLQGAFTETSSTSWLDCIGLVGTQPNVFFWHHWPDLRMHQLADDGSAFRKFHEETTSQLLSEDFWSFIRKLASGRPLIITSDHGYAVSGNFPDVPDEHGKSLKEFFKSGRCAMGEGQEPQAIPPYFLTLDHKGPPCRQILGQRKWKSPGGYPKLVHGGLTLLEVFSPLIILKLKN